ncbi:MAG: NAD(P)H-dependent oxidoreductase [Bacteroidales bacterium]|nr:NAD(P)H-dependent oxidoreductase [Bacteroidales bacterium]
MKRILFLLAFVSLTFLPLASCSADPLPLDPEEKEEHEKEQEQGKKEKPEKTGSRTLLVWYSFTGNSAAIAAALRSHITVDALEIKPAIEGLDYSANNYAIGSSLIAAIRGNPSEASSYPTIKEVEIEFDEYDTVIIVTPLWWSQMAAPMQSFLFRYGGDMAGKTIGLIVTSASSGISGVEQDAKRLIPQGNILAESLWIRSAEVSDAPGLTSAWYDRLFTSNNDNTSMKVTITAGGKAFTADIEDSETGRAFLDKLPLTLDMSELNGNEKYCYGLSLPRNDRHFDRLEAGDLMLYSGNCIVLFYGAAGGYSYTRIGKITDTAGLASSLGSGNVSVKFERH